MGGSRLDSRKSRVHGTIGRKKAAKSGADCHSVNLTFPENRREGTVMEKSDAKWKARIYKDKVLKPAIKDQLQILSQVVLCSKELKIEYYKDIVYADGKTKLFDQYPSCKHWEKKYCQCKPKRYRGYVTPGGYVFFGDSEIEIYCKVIAAFGNEESPLIIPFSEM